MERQGPWGRRPLLGNLVEPKYLTAESAEVAERQVLRIQPRAGDGNRPDCSGEVIRESLESVDSSLRASRTNGESIRTGG